MDKDVNVDIISNRIQGDPVFCIQEIFGKDLWSKQREIVWSVENNSRTTVKGCHGFGKTLIAGNIALQFLPRHKNSIVITTAPTYKQITKLVWKEIRDSYSNSKINLGGTLYLGKPEFHYLKDIWYAIGIPSSDPDKFQGFHADNILVIVDEAAGISDLIFEAIEGILTTSNSRLLLIGNPTNNIGEFYRSFKDPSYSKFTISAFDTPNFKYLGISRDDIATGKWEEKFEQKGKKLLEPKLVTPEWVADKYKRWGSTSRIYTIRVEGKFAEDSADYLIPLSWIELAMEREYEQNDGVVELGVDIAEFGRDFSQVAIKVGSTIKPLVTLPKERTMETAGRIKNIWEKEKASCVKIDVIGIGTGVEGRLFEQGIPTERINVAESPGGLEDQKEKYVNKKSQLFWHLRERLNPDGRENPAPLSLPKDEDLLFELSSIKYKIMSNGRIQIESKDDLKKRIGRSPDRADAVMLACAPVNLISKEKRKAGVW